MGLSLRPYSARTWNDWMRLLKRWHPREGINAEISYTPNGVIIGASVEVAWRHPWSMRFAFDHELETWRAFVWPGFVNGRDVTITRALDKGTEEVPLFSETPAGLGMAWRNPLLPSGLSVSDEGEFVYAPGERYPKFFEGLGVKPTAPGGTLEAAEFDPKRTKELRVCDVVLTTPRIATKSAVSLLDPGTGPVMTIDTVFVNDYFRSAPSRHRLVAVPKWSSPLEPSLLDRMMGEAVEPQTDELLMARVWAVSPENAGAEANPDEGWQLYAEHFVFWNLMHASIADPPAVPDKPLVFETGLALGLGNPLFAALLNPVNDAFAKIDAFFGAANYKGGYWST